MEKINQYAIFVLFALLLISFGFNIYNIMKPENSSRKTTTTIITKKDTIRDTVPIVKSEKEIKYIYDTLNQIVTLRDTVNNTITRIDTVPTKVEIPITQNLYSDDSTYTAWISGYKPNLDSINIYRKTIYIDKETIVTKSDNKKFSIGPVIYGGYDFRNKQLGYGLGIGFTYNIWKW